MGNYSRAGYVQILLSCKLCSDNSEFLLQQWDFFPLSEGFRQLGVRVLAAEVQIHSLVVPGHNTSLNVMERKCSHWCYSGLFKLTLSGQKVFSLMSAEPN